MKKLLQRSLFLSLVMVMLLASNVFASQEYSTDDIVDTSGFEVLATYDVPININLETNEITVVPPEESPNATSQATLSNVPINGVSTVANLNVVISKTGQNLYADFTITSLDAWSGILSWSFSGQWSNGFNDVISGFGGGLKVVRDQSQTTFSTSGSHTFNVYGGVTLTNGSSGWMDVPLVLTFTT